jgi:sec-independent protein translocase protein TatA
MGFLPGPMELVIILIIVAMLFGVGRLPEVFGAVGKGIREFRRETTPGPDAKVSSVPPTSEGEEPTETENTKPHST